MDIEAVYGLGEALVSGVLTPDLFVVEKSTGRVLEKKVARQEWKLTRNSDLSSTWDEANIQEDVLPALQSVQKISDDQVMALCLLGKRIEALYGHPQDIEWAIEKGEIYVVQARAITTLAGVPDILRKVTAKVLLKGAGASPGMQSGRVRLVLRVEDSAKVQAGDVLVAETTTPDFVPAMKKAAAIVTDRGGRTAHAAIVSRELGIPCVVGTEMATAVLVDGQEVTVEGTQGLVYEGSIQIEKA
jgi:pyruvate,water dikinase